MKKISVFAIAAALAFLSPAPAEAQQDPALVGLGAQVYLSTCGRCHNARPGSERTDREWMAIVAHMRARANISKTHSAAVLAFLQATNVPEGVPAVPTGPQLELPDKEPPPPSGEATRGVPSAQSHDR